MSRSSLYRAAGGVILALGLTSFAAGDLPAPMDLPVKNEASAAKRIVYILKNGSAKDLAPILAAHFKGVAEVEALPEPTDNCLLISASPAAFEEVIKALDKSIDGRKRRRSISGSWMSPTRRPAATGPPLPRTCTKRTLPGRSRTSAPAWKRWKRRALSPP